MKPTYPMYNITTTDIIYASILQRYGSAYQKTLVDLRYVLCLQSVNKLGICLSSLAILTSMLLKWMLPEATQETQQNVFYCSSDQSAANSCGDIFHRRDQQPIHLRPHSIIRRQMQYLRLQPILCVRLRIIRRNNEDLIAKTHGYRDVKNSLVLKIIY